mgnify:CR=1 FL=1
MSVELEAARQMLLDLVRVLPVEQVPLEESWQRVMAETVIADSDFPPFDRSPLDGYALIAGEVSQATPHRPVVLTEIDSISAGSLASKEVTSGTACRIMTGAPIPPGATGVVRLEDTTVQGKQVTILSGAGLDKNICFRGEELASGTAVVEPGTVVNMGVMGMLAMVGNYQPHVYQRPRVALIATGSELVGTGEPLAPGKIRNSNSYMLSAQTREAGSDPVLLGTAKDDVAAIIKLIRSCGDYKVCITTGGASVGDYDLIGEVFQQMGIEILFDRINMKPGMPVLAGTKDGILYIGLSGNPAAASIAFEQIVRPVLLAMGGRRDIWRPVVQARLTGAFKKATGSKRFVWAKVEQGKEGLIAEPLRLQGNGMLQSAIHANALIVIPADSPPLPEGTVVDIMVLV